LYTITSAVRLGLTVSAALAGTVVGSLVAGIPGEKLGGRQTLRIAAVLNLVGDPIDIDKCKYIDGSQVPGNCAKRP